MRLQLDVSCAATYTSNAQKARVITEQWFAKNMFCPVCGASMLRQYGANRPVADFYCERCRSDFELKSKKSGKSGNDSRFAQGKITDGAYETMIDRITSLKNPHLFYMTHLCEVVWDLIFIPRFFFVPSIIERRNPLSAHARRAGWVGCNINLSSVPNAGKIFIVQNGKAKDTRGILADYKQIKALQSDNMKKRGWLLDVLLCLEKMPLQFSLQDMYAFESFFAQRHSENHHVREKIRQQLQVLRDKGMVEFMSRGTYRKL